MAVLWTSAAWIALLQSGGSTAAQHPLGWRHALIAGCLLASGLAALQGWRRAPQGRLRWDAAQWFWSETGSERAVTVALELDLQRRVLVRAQARDSAARWLWLDASGADDRWHEVRCALHAPQARGAAAAVPAATVPTR